METPDTAGDRAVDRAVVVSFDGDRVLVIRRTKDGRRYAVLPGGGVEPGEVAAAAALRELGEETGLPGALIRPLWTLHHDDRRADYFLVTVAVAPMTMSGPEVDQLSSANRYEPCWVGVADLDAENLQPDGLRPLLRQLATELLRPTQDRPDDATRLDG